MGRKKTLIPDKRFGRLSIVAEVGRTKSGDSRWLCECDCGKSCIVVGSNLRSGHTRSCGCYNSELITKRNTKHGSRKTKLYGVWNGIKSRCYRPNVNGYSNYGMRGISMCAEWKDSFEAFEKWAFSSGYEEGLSIDRIDVNGNYCPENCRWATSEMQVNNKRNSIHIDINGESKTLGKLSTETGIPYATLYGRYVRGVSVDELLRKGNNNG